MSRFINRESKISFGESDYSGESNEENKKRIEPLV